MVANDAPRFQLEDRRIITCGPPGRSCRAIFARGHASDYIAASRGALACKRAAVDIARKWRFNGRALRPRGTWAEHFETFYPEKGLAAIS